KPRQGLVTRFDPGTSEGFSLLLDGSDGVSAVVGGGQAVHTRCSTGKVLEARRWYRVWASYDAGSRTLCVGHREIGAEPAAGITRSLVVDHGLAMGRSVPLYLGAAGGTPVGGLYNGKMERPRIIDRAVEPEQLMASLPLDACAVAD